MSVPVILAIDEGTTNAKAVCINQDGQIIAKGSKSLSISHPQSAWSEQNPYEIIESVRSAIKQALTTANDLSVQAIAISNQRESILIWERATGTPLTPVVSWQCRRSEAFCQSLAASSDADLVQRSSGLPIDPLFPAAKINVLLNELPEGRERAKAGELCIGTIDVWLAWNLTGGKAFVTDPSNASRTQLFNIHNQSWDSALLEVFDIPFAALPEVLPSSCVRGESYQFDGLPDGIPVMSQVGDSHAALYGQGGFIPGVIKATYGTGSSLMTPVEDISGDDYRLGKTIAWHDGQLTYALEGNITHTGAGVAWMSRMLGISDLNTLTEMAAAEKGNGGVYFVPALSGLGAPYWQSDARGLITGLTDFSTPSTLARAALESIIYQIADVFYLMEQMSGRALDALLVDGGPTQSKWLMQSQADLLQRPVIRSKTAEVSALGAGYLAGKALGWWSSREQLAALERNFEIIEPISAHTDLQDNYLGWKAAIQRTLFQPTNH